MVMAKVLNFDNVPSSYMHLVSNVTGYKRYDGHPGALGILQMHNFFS